LVDDALGMSKRVATQAQPAGLWRRATSAVPVAGICNADILSCRTIVRLLNAKLATTSDPGSPTCRLAVDWRYTGKRGFHSYYLGLMAEDTGRDPLEILQERIGDPRRHRLLQCIRGIRQLALTPAVEPLPGSVYTDLAGRHECDGYRPWAEPWEDFVYFGNDPDDDPTGYVDPIFAKPWLKLIRDEPGVLLDPLDEWELWPSGVEGYLIAGNGADVILLKQSGRDLVERVGCYFGAALAIREDCQGMRLGAELVLEAALARGGAPIGMLDEPGYSPAGFAAHVAGWKLACQRARAACLEPTDYTNGAESEPRL
jgi:hypothetical protein